MYYQSSYWVTIKDTPIFRNQALSILFHFGGRGAATVSINNIILLVYKMLSGIKGDINTYFYIHYSGMYTSLVHTERYPQVLVRAILF